MTPEHLRILKTLPKVIEAVKAFQTEADELRALLAAPADSPMQTLPCLASIVPPAAPPVLATLRAVPDPRAEETRRAAEEELARRQAARSPEQVEADNYLAAHAAERKSILGAILPGGAP